MVVISLHFLSSIGHLVWFLNSFCRKLLVSLEQKNEILTALALSEEKMTLNSSIFIMERTTVFGKDDAK